jgi:hypothetical protein
MDPKILFALTRNLFNMLFPYATEHVCDTNMISKRCDGSKVLTSTLWIDILQTIGAIEKGSELANLEDIMEGIGCYDSEGVLEFIGDLVRSCFLEEVGYCWRLTPLGKEFV